ncbi:MAG: LuxR C-terminal-related transcriptional regulator [Vulcanimicrobiaceae bacterium]
MKSIRQRLFRSRVNGAIERACEYPIAMIAAPAGFGKSVALADYLESEHVTCVRYDVRKDDRSLLAFVRGLSEAFSQVAPSAVAAFPSAQQLAMSGADPARELASWFEEHVRAVSCTAVIDDLHHADDEAVTRFLQIAIEGTIPRIRWLLVSRVEPGLPLASWVAYGKMDIPIGESTLRFTLEEALAAADPSDDKNKALEVRELLTLTDGWPVAFAIALRTATHIPDLRAVALGTREMVYRYLAEQVFSRLDLAQQRFLLETCVYQSIDYAIVDARGDAPAILSDLRRSVTFVTPASEGEYRYHDLFRDFLLDQAQRAGASAFVNVLRDAARVLESLGRYGDALLLLARARDVDGISRILERHGFDLLDRGEIERLDQALDVLATEEAIAGAKVTALRATLESNRGRFDVASAWFERAIASAAEPRLRAELTYRHAIELVRNDRDCIALLEPYVKDRSTGAALHASIVATLATAYTRAGRHDQARTAIALALADEEEGLPDPSRARLSQQAAFVYLYAGDSDAARRYASMAIEASLRYGLYEVAARAYSVLYVLSSDVEDDPAESLRVLERMAECARKAASEQARLFALTAAYDIEADRGDEAALERLDEELRAQASIYLRGRLESFLPARALRLGWSGDFFAAYALLAGTEGLQQTPERKALRLAEIAVYAVPAGVHEAAEKAIPAATELLNGAQVDRRVARTRAFLAIAELARGHAQAAHRHIAEVERQAGATMPRMRALIRAVRTMYAVQVGQAEPQSLRGAFERLRIEQLGGIARLLERLSVPPTADAGLGNLTPTERTVLRMLTRGASSKSIAMELGRSSQTIDVHIRSICRKLGCSGRLEAIALANASGFGDTQ